MRALVTGATGFIGSHVARALLEAGWEVRGLRRSSAPPWQLTGPEPEWFTGDLGDLDSLRRAVAGCDAVFHVAGHYALWAPDEEVFEAVNVQGTRNVLLVAREAEVQRVVYTSSVACVGAAPPGGLADEDTPVAESELRGGYERSKLAAERLALAAAAEGQDVVVVNPASTIGPGDIKPTPTGKIVLDFIEGRIPFYLDTGLNFVDVRDVAAGHLLAWERGVSGRRYILGHPAGNLSLRDFLGVVGRAAGRRPPRLRIPYSLAWVAGLSSTFLADRVTGRPPAVPLVGVQLSRRRMAFDPTRAITELGLQHRPLEQTVADAVAWFRQTGRRVAASPS
ncbi:MAG: NAD-dependent epimerase/dehydratase family protein [Planctomycetes bacterium]|nr:NAD-dependent epimerase/dehydratase family protein [Planctomycetota bacterium]